MEDRKLADELSQISRFQRALGALSGRERNAMLEAIAHALETQKPRIAKANERDLLAADNEQLPIPLRKRLVCDEDKLDTICTGLRQVASLADPIGRVREKRLLDTGLILERVDVPIGVIGMIFESRPDALVQILSLCLKSGNAIILKGGKEALQTNRELVAIVRETLEQFSVGSGWIIHLEQREDVHKLLEMNEIVDLLIPRGSNEFVRYIMDHTKIPVLGHADGICALYVDQHADIDMAVSVAVDSKCQYPAVCNAIETLLVHKKIAPQFLPKFRSAVEPWSVIIHGDSAVQGFIPCVAAAASDWDTEYLGYEIAIKVVSSPEEAITHIAEHSSGHTECIVTEDVSTARTFLREVDSADVFWNCSTRFADGFRFGLGAEVGISTQKIHARGPVGLDGLVIGKWLLAGKGHIVDTYAKGKEFIHEELPVNGTSLYSEEEV
jgi:glutamate-5-semialdehyde dehydrogenase